MYSDTFTGRWDQLRDDVKRKWNKLTDDDLDQIKGDMERLVSLIEEKYGYTRDQAQQDVTRFMDSHDNRMTQMVRRLPAEMDSEVRKRPWAAVATAIGIGLALGLMVRPGHAITDAAPVE